MNKYILSVIFWTCTISVVLAKYNPELDVRGINDASDGVELQLATPSNDHFIGMFSGHNCDPNPVFHFNANDVFRIATGDADFNGFTEWFTVRGNGMISYADEPQSELHLNGEFSTPWDASFYDYSSSFGPGFEHLRWLNRDWSGSLWDFTYLGGSGGRDNDVQAAMILSHREGILYGKGSISAEVTSTAHVRIDENGNVGIGDSAPDGAYSLTALPASPDIIANVSLPHGSTIPQITVYCKDNDASNGVRFCLGRLYNVTGAVICTARLFIRDSVYRGVSSSTSSIALDNQQYAYAFRMQPTAAGAGYMDSNFKFHQAIFQYSE